MKLKATSFATRQDLARFSAAVTAGDSVQQALTVGDNGVGAWGDRTWERDAVMPIIALGPSLARRFDWWRVTMHGRTLNCIVLDIGPEGICDFAPSALVAFGFGPDTELLASCVVERVAS